MELKEFLKYSVLSAGSILATGIGREISLRLQILVITGFFI
jgi:hypothetical protein